MAKDRNQSDVRMRGFPSRMELAIARRLAEELVRPLSEEQVSLEQVVGRVLARDLRASVSVPSFVRAAMDGYAVRAEETFGASEYNPLSFRLAGEALPGRPFAAGLESGEAVRIMTGAPMPHGADAVVQAEYASESESQAEKSVQLTEPVAPGRHVGQIGEDITSGQVVLRQGRVLRPQDVGVAASIGIARVAVVQRPIVRLVITGDELLPPGSCPTGTQIVDSNSLMLDALVKRDGGIPLRGSIVPDRKETVESTLLDPTGDVILVSGGSSVGAEDYAPVLLAQHGELLVHGVAMRPSSPAGFGRLGLKPVFLLPGNPVSCLCAYEFFAGPAIRILGGRSPDWPHRQLRAPLAQKIASAIGRVDYVRVRMAEGGVEVSTDHFAWQVHLEAPRGVWIDDSDFDLLPGEVRRIAARGPAQLVERIQVSALNGREG